MEKRKLKKLGKRGSAVDLALLVGVIAVFSCLVLVGLAVYTSWDDNIQANDQIPSEAKSASTSIKGVYTGVLDWGILVLVGILGIGTIGLAALVRIHSVFIVFFIVLWLILILVAGIGANVYDEMASNPFLSASADELGTVTAIVTTLPWVVLVIGVLVMIVMYKSRGDV